jgi:hypothetical protein
MLGQYPVRGRAGGQVVMVISEVFWGEHAVAAAAVGGDVGADSQGYLFVLTE